MKRISDLSLTGNYLIGLSRLKNQVSDLNVKISTGRQINKPSDSPTGTSQILRMGNILSQGDSYANNIQNSLSFLNETSFAMESIQSDITDVLTNLTSLQNPTNDSNLNSFAEQIDLSLKSILNLANSEYDGKYIFGGTDISKQPYGLTGDGNSVEAKVDVSGEQNVKFSQNIIQKVNMSGQEIFGTTILQNGNVNLNNSTGDSVANQLSIYDAEGNQYTLNLNYTKTADNTYSLTYDVLDSTSTSIFASAPSAKTLTFDSLTGVLKSVDGSSSFSFRINDSSKKIDFKLDLSSLQEKNSADSISLSANQKMDIFNTLISIRDNLKIGIKPTDEQVQAVKDFNSRMVNKISQNGNVVNILNDTSDLITNQQTNIEELLASKQSVDTAKAITDLQNLNYTLEINYKLASMYLPKSLLDYL